MLNATKHIRTEVDASKIEQSNAEVTFVGRSNAGKSTLINALCQQKRLAYVSQTPGKTRTINVYAVRPYHWLVDLPGYGYAVGAEAEKTPFGMMVEGYLTTRKNLTMVFVIVDAFVGPTKLDLSMINWLKHHDYPYSVIVNKIDKVGPAKLDVRKKEITALIGVESVDIFWISGKNKKNIEPLQKQIAVLLEMKPTITHRGETA